LRLLSVPATARRKNCIQTARTYRATKPHRPSSSHLYGPSAAGNACVRYVAPAYSRYAPAAMIVSQ